MSIITTRSTLLSILKGPNASRNSFHKVRFQLPNDIKKIFLDFKTGCNSKEYENLVCIIRDSEISDFDLLSLLNEAKNCIHLLNYELRLFIQALILIRWAHRNEDVVKCYQEFINDLVSAHSQHTKVVIDQLIKLFLNSEEAEWSENTPSELLVKQFDNIHYILQSVMDTIPMSEDLLLKSVKHNFPYLKSLTHKQLSYVYNSLKIIQYQPTLRRNILQIIINALVTMDVQAPREEILQCQESNDNLVFEMEVDNEPSAEPEPISMKHPLANTLDLLMDLLFKFIRNECYQDDELTWTNCRKLYTDLLDVFENVILCTHASHHVQFVMFYLCSFDNKLASDYLKFLWKKATSLNVPAIIRHTSIAYLSSFLARAEYLNLGYLKLYLSKMSDWIHRYIANHDGTNLSYMDSKKHYVFYSVCQAVFYLIAFRHQDLMDSSKKLVYLQSLNLTKMITCKLNPLRVCMPSVLENFASVTRASQLAYCYTIMENNARNKLPQLSERGEIIGNTVIEMYFAFEPYVLLRSNAHIKPLYKEYNSLVSDELIEHKERRRKKSGVGEEDDFIGDGSVGSDPIRNKWNFDMQN